MATIGDLITIVREDYLYDVVFPYRWSEAFLLRSFLEAERQACNRWDLIYDDTTAGIASITLSDATASYSLSSKITAIKRVAYGSIEVIKQSKHEIDVSIPTWRTDSGMANKTLYYVISGRKLRITPMPSTATDAPIGSLSLEVYRLPSATTITTAYTPEIAEEHHKSLIHWVLYEAYMKKDVDGVENPSYDPKQALLHLEQFDAYFGKPVPAAVRQNQLEENPVLCLRPIAYSKTSSTDEDEDW